MYFDDDEFEYQIQMSKQSIRDKLNKERLCEIHPSVNIHYNSLNVLCGPQSSGKSYTAMKEAAKISQLDPYAHLIVIVCKPENQDDPTIDIFKPLIKVPIIYLHEDDAEERMKRFYEYKRLYTQIKDEHLEERIADDQVEEIFETLHINDFSRPWLHTMLIVNDSAKSKLFKAGAYFSQLIAIGRHTQTTTFLNIQFWKGLTPEIKANISTAVIFGGFSRQQLVHILSQLPSQYDYKEIYNVYRQLSKQQKLMFRESQISVLN